MALFGSNSMRDQNVNQATMRRDPKTSKQRTKTRISQVSNKLTSQTNSNMIKRSLIINHLETPQKMSHKRNHQGTAVASRHKAGIMGLPDTSRSTTLKFKNPAEGVHSGFIFRRDRQGVQLRTYHVNPPYKRNPMPAKQNSRDHRDNRSQGCNQLAPSGKVFLLNQACDKHRIPNMNMLIIICANRSLCKSMQKLIIPQTGPWRETSPSLSALANSGTRTSDNWSSVVTGPQADASDAWTYLRKESADRQHGTTGVA